MRIVINLTKDCEPTIEELAELSKRLKKLINEFPFMKDWELEMN